MVSNEFLNFSAVLLSFTVFCMETFKTDCILMVFFSSSINRTCSWTLSEMAPYILPKFFTSLFILKFMSVLLLDGAPTLMLSR